MRLIYFLSVLLLVLTGCSQHKIKIKTVIVTFFEPEREAIVSKLDLDHDISFSQGYLPLKTDNKGTLLVTTGIGNSRAAASLMGLGMDSRFDLSQAYFILSGIGGGDPKDVSLGSVVFEDYLVNADMKYSIDNREMPQSWDFGFVPMDKSKPYDKPLSKPYKNNEYYKLNQDLLKWAYSVNKETKLSKESKSLLKKKSFYTNYPNAQKKPFLIIGAGLDGEDFWHGVYKTRWANKWVQYFTQAKSNFMVSAMEGAGALQSLHFLAGAKKINENHILILRSVSNFSLPGKNISAYDNLMGEESSYSAFQDSLENLSRVSEVTVKEILSNWDKMKNKY